MLLIRKKAFARAGLMGNPSDGYGGKTLSVALHDFAAEVSLYEWEDVELVWSQEDQSRFRSVRDLVRDVRLHGYYGGIRLVKATVKRFVEYCDQQGHTLHDRNFSLRYESTIPRQLGLGGSSAIIVATLRCLMEFYEVEIPREVQPSLTLSVENRELGIAGGLQDRVIQVYEGLVFMDFSPEAMHEQAGLRCGKYEELDPAILPPLYIAYSADESEPTEVVHNNLRMRYDSGEQLVVSAMRQFADYAQRARAALLSRDYATFGELVNANFDLRAAICQIPAGQAAMIAHARAAGATAKFAGSGGAIVGTYADQAMYERLTAEMAKINCQVIIPRIVSDRPVSA